MSALDPNTKAPFPLFAFLAEDGTIHLAGGLCCSFPAGAGLAAFIELSPDAFSGKNLPEKQELPPYLWFSTVESGDHSGPGALRLDPGLCLRLRDQYREAVELCLDPDSLPGRTQPERLFSFCFDHPEILNLSVPMSCALVPLRTGEPCYEEAQFSFQGNAPGLGLTEALEQLAAVQQGKSAHCLLPCYLLSSLEELLWFEFSELLRRGRSIKRCRACGRYFLCQDHRRRDFCDRPGPDGRTCRQRGAKDLYQRKLEEDPYRKAYTTAYNRMYSRYFRSARGEGAGFSQEEFQCWAKSAREARRAYAAGDISGEQLLQRIGEPPPDREDVRSGRTESPLTVK